MKQTLSELAKLLGDKLNANKLMLTTAESCTGGGIAYYITSVSGSSGWFQQSFVTYSNQAKQELVNVSAETLEKFGAVSEQTVVEMAKGAKLNSAADIAIAVSGIAGPEGGSVEKPVGTVWFCWIIDDTVHTEKKCFDGDRNQVRESTISYSFSFLIKQL